MNLIDSSCWLEYFADGPNADQLIEVFENLDGVIVPTICLYEVFKVILREAREDDAILAVAVMKQARVIDLDPEIAMMAARISHEQKLPMADSMVLATAQAHDAVIWTQDADFQGKPSVRYFSR